MLQLCASAPHAAKRHGARVAVVAARSVGAVAPLGEAGGATSSRAPLRLLGRGARDIAAQPRFSLGGASGSGLGTGGLAPRTRRRPVALPLFRRRGISSVPLTEVLAACEEAASEEAQAVAGPAGKSIQGVLWFANIYPTKANRFDIRGSLTHHNHETLIPKLLPAGVEILRTVPREREGGVFVYWRAPPRFALQVLKASQTTEVQRFIKKGDVDIMQKVSSGICQYLKTHNVRAFLVPLPVRAYTVKGEPYLEELQSRFPSSRLRVKVEPTGALTEEEVYEQMRRFGSLLDIVKLEDNKGFSVAFTYTAAAVAARNCLHRAKLSTEQEEEAAKLQIEFEPFMRKWVREAITSNARYSVPLLVFMLLGTTYLVCDPVRSFGVQFKVANLLVRMKPWEDPSSEELEVEAKETRTALSSMPGFWTIIVRMLAFIHRAQASIDRASERVGLRGKRDWHRALLEDFWADRNDEVSEIRSWLADPKDQVMLITGRRGNGQSAFVRDICGVRGMYLNVAQMLEAGGAFDDRIFLQELCRPFGYWPTQGMDRQMTALLDLILPGSGKLSRENEVLVAVQRILSCVTSSLVRWRDRRHRDPEWAHLPGSGVPLIIVDGFTSENKNRRDGFFESLVTWAAYLSEEKLARVLFIADSSFAEPSMLAALGNRPERLVIRELNDSPTSSVRPLFARHFGPEHRANRLTDQEILSVGGRFRDIAALVDQVHHGTPPSQAVRKLADGAEATVRGLLMRGQKDAKWTRPQLWRAVRVLAQPPAAEGVPYDVFLWQVFRGDELALQSMKESNLIAVAPIAAEAAPAKDALLLKGGGIAARRYKVLPGSPLFAEAYRRIVGLTGLTAVLDLEVAKEDIKREQGALDAYEAELARLQEVDDVRYHKGRGLLDPNQALRDRKVQLLGLIQEQHAKLEAAHAERRAAMKILKKRKHDFLEDHIAGEKASQPERRSTWIVRCLLWLTRFGVA